jgi:hypothetical protein
MWTAWPDSHKRYDSFSNEWDINEALDPNGVAEEDDDFEDCNNDIGKPADNPPDVEQQDSGCDTESLGQLLCYRYGMVLPGPDFRLIDPDCPTLPWDKVRAILGDVESPLDEKYKYPVTVFLGCFLSPRFSQVLPTLRHIWDLHDQCPYPIRDLERNFAVGFTIVEGSDGCQYYRLHRSATSPPWELLVERAVDALECLRRSWGPEAGTIAEAFLDRGIPFRTMLPLLPSMNLRPPLDNAPIDRELAVDYALSERRRQELLRGPRGRAALMQGGIAWRLARETLKDDVVMAGPAPFNSQSWVLGMEAYKYYDDILSEDDEFILCGGHHVQAGRETTVLYWWPKPSVWAACGFNLGFWPEVAEDWFNHRREEIRNGTATPRTNKQWKNGLARYRHTRTFTDTIEKASARFMSS